MWHAGRGRIVCHAHAIELAKGAPEVFAHPMPKGVMTDDAAAWHLRRLDDDPYQPPALIALHATLMTCAFMVMMPLGVIFARALPKNSPKRIQMHKRTQSAASLLVLVGIIIAMTTISTPSDLFSTDDPHQMVSLLSIVFLIPTLSPLPLPSSSPSPRSVRSPSSFSSATCCSPSRAHTHLWRAKSAVAYAWYGRQCT